MSIKDQEDGQKEEDGPTDSTSDEARKQQRRNNRSPPAWEAARCSRAACRAACRAAGSTLAASAAFISSTSTAFVCSVSIVIAQFAVRHCELGTGGSHAAPLVAVHVGRAEAFELAEAVTAGLEAAVRRYTTAPPHQPPAPPPSPSGKNDLETHIIVDFPLAGAGYVLCQCTPTYAPCQAKQSGRDPRLAPGTGLAQRDRSQSLPACEEASATSAPPQHHRRVGSPSSARIHTPVMCTIPQACDVLRQPAGSHRSSTERGGWVQHGQRV
jgi:hypothetical protein